MKKKRAEQVLQTTLSFRWFDYICPPVISIGMKKKRAEQVLQTTVSLTLFELQMSTCNTNRNEKKTCRAGVADNGLIYIVCTSNVHLYYQ